MKKKAAKKAAAKGAKKAAKKAPDTAEPATADETESDRTPISSAPQDVIEVGQSDPSTRRTGWWNRG